MSANTPRGADYESYLLFGNHTVVVYLQVGSIATMHGQVILAANMLPLVYFVAMLLGWTKFSDRVHCLRAEAVATELLGASRHLLRPYYPGSLQRNGGRYY